jgi:uncharacterized OB-fold protein
MIVTNDTEAKARFWEFVQERAMQLPYCNGCERFFYYPRAFCPHCWSADVAFRPAAGDGTIWSYTVVRFAHGEPSAWHAKLPYAIGLIDLVEGVRMMANIVDCDVDTIRSGMPVTLTYVESDGRLIPAFALRG